MTSGSFELSSRLKNFCGSSSATLLSVMPTVTQFEVEPAANVNDCEFRTS